MGELKDVAAGITFPANELPTALEGSYVGGFLPYSMYRDRFSMMTAPFWERKRAEALTKGLTVIHGEVNGTVFPSNGADIKLTDYREALLVSGPGASEFYTQLMAEAQEFIKTLPK